MASTAPAAIFNSNGSAKTNPFASSLTGLWQFYADDGTFDIRLSGGGIPAPFTWGAQNLYTGQYRLPVAGSILTTVSAKLNSFYEAVADFGADPTNTSNSTAAAQAAITAAISAHNCALFVGGRYKLSFSSVASLVLPSNACVKGESNNNTVFLESTANATIMAVTGHNVNLKDFYLAFETGVTATSGTGLSLYPDVTSTSQVVYTYMDNVSIGSRFCDEDPTNACQAAANANKLLYGVLIQSGVFDTLFMHSSNLFVRWATNGVYMISGGLAGSSGFGGVIANKFVATEMDGIVDGFTLAPSGENFFLSTRVDDATHAAWRFISNPNGGTYGSQASSHNHIETYGEGNINLADFTAANSNVIFYAGDETSVSTGNIPVIGAQRSSNTVSAPGIFSTGFYPASTISSGTYTSGGTFSGSSSQTCLLTFPGGVGTATVALTGSNTIAGGTALTSISVSGVFTTGPITASLSSGTATCSGTAVVATVIAASATSLDPFMAAGILDFNNSPNQATVDLRSTPNNPYVMRIRQASHPTLTNWDFLNLDLSKGWIIQDDASSPLTKPVATFQKNFTTGASPNSFIRFTSGVNPLFVGDVDCGFVNTGAVVTTQCRFGVQNSLGIENYPFTVVGDGTVKYPVSGFSANNVVCFKASGVLGYAVVTAGSTGTCN